MDSIIHSQEYATDVVKDQIHPGMYRIKWSTGRVSDEMWNLPRANDIHRRCKFGAKEEIEG